MSSDTLHDLYKTLKDSLYLPEGEVNDIATKLLEADEDQFVTRKMRLEAIAVHSNFSRDIYNRILWEFDKETLVSEKTNILHLMISNPHTTLEDIQTLSEYAKDTGKEEWFENVVMKTLDLSEYHLNLKYNGEHIFQDEKVRANLTKTSNLLDEFLNSDHAAWEVALKATQRPTQP